MCARVIPMNNERKNWILVCHGGAVSTGKVSSGRVDWFIVDTGRDAVGRCVLI